MILPSQTEVMTMSLSRILLTLAASSFVASAAYAGPGDFVSGGNGP